MKTSDSADVEVTNEVGHLNFFDNHMSQSSNDEGRASSLEDGNASTSKHGKIVIAPSHLCHCLSTLSLIPRSLNLFLVCLDRLCHLAILCLDQHAHTLHHLESLLTISLDRLDILKEDLVYESLQKSLSLILKLY
ncbi:hypothetical protein Tco_0755720 [Tanacetum coccineum]